MSRIIDVDFHVISFAFLFYHKSAAVNKLINIFPLSRQIGGYRLVTYTFIDYNVNEFLLM